MGIRYDALGLPTHLSLFSGVDAFSLALEAHGVYTQAQVEVEPYCRLVLQARFPHATLLDDVREVDAGAPRPTVLTGGFPCQDLSPAGNGKGLDGERSVLGLEIPRIAGALRPSLVMVENVPRLLGLHFERLLRAFHDVGYDCEWDVISAAAVGAPHLRERLWLLAYPSGSGRSPRVFGDPVKPSHDLAADGVKWPRAGQMFDGRVFELEPVAPRKTKRVDGRTYWVGVDLLGWGTERCLIPSPRATDGDRGGRGDLIQVVRGNSNGHFGSAMWPSPSARDWKDTGNGRMGRGQLPEAVRARSLLPTPAATSHGHNIGGQEGRRGKVKLSLPEMAVTGYWSDTVGVIHCDDGSEFRIGEIDRLIAEGKATLTPADPLWPSPRASWNENRGTKRAPSSINGTHGRKLGEEVAETEVNERERGQLNPDWVEWMMGLPVGWTDLACESPRYVPFSDEPLPRVLKSCPDRRPRLQAIGNSLVWLVPYWILSRYPRDLLHDHSM